jgi:hypothetical protein
MSIGDKIADLGAKVAELYKELVTNTVRFEELEKHTAETLQAFRKDLLALSAKVDGIHVEHVKHQAEVKSLVQVLEGRLNMLSEKALHVAIRDVAREYVRGQDVPSAPVIPETSGQAAPPSDS